MPIIDKVQLQRTEDGHEWRGRDGAIQVRFVGRPIDGVLCSPWPLAHGVRRTVTPRQVHSRSVRRVPPVTALVPADGLVTASRGTALLVITADCVPLLAFDGRTAVAVHAGWRGLASRIVPRGLSHLDRSRPWQLWLGPHIGRCCYEVGADVADRVAAASSAAVVIAGPGSRPHLDMARAVIEQAAPGPDDRLTVFKECTRCNPGTLWSYRREGPGGGRNLAVIVVGES